MRDDAIAAALRTHAQRRASGVPAVSMLLGDGADCAKAWRAWAEPAHGVLETSATSPAKLALAWAAWTFLDANIAREALPHLAARAECDIQDLTARMPGMTRHERALLLRRAFGAETGAVPRFYMLLYLQDAPPATARAWLALLAEGDGALFAVAEVAVTCLPAVRTPALLITPEAGGLEVAAKMLGALASAFPGVPAAITVPAAAFQHYLDDTPESREMALLRESILRIGPAEEFPAGGFNQDVERGLERLQREAMPEAVVSAYREAAETLREKPVPADAEDRARSAAERFLFLCLEALEATSGLFELNGQLPFAFGPRPYMEIDLLCRRFRIAVEIDGYYHFQDPARYRSDRKKDYLLQAEAYWVLRFLANDVVMDLERILDRILAALDLRRNAVP